MIVFRYPALCAIPIALLGQTATAQDAIAYETGEYAYAQEAEDSGSPKSPEEGITFRVREIVQPIPSIDPDEPMDSTKAAPESEPAMIAVAEEPRILYAYPAVYARPPEPGSASRVIHRRGNARSSDQYTYVYEGSAPSLPAGARIVEFDRSAWLAECRRRLAPVSYYEEDDRAEATPGGDDQSGQCEAYLDGYMESARTGGLHGHTSASGDYMLVPVTVMIPQRVVYGDGTRDER